MVVLADAVNVVLEFLEHVLHIDNQNISHLQLSRLFELLHVTLTFPHTASSKENISMVAIDILGPSGQPRHSIVVLDRLPRPRHVGNRNRCIL